MGKNVKVCVKVRGVFGVVLLRLKNRNKRGNERSCIDNLAIDT